MGGTTFQTGSMANLKRAMFLLKIFAPNCFCISSERLFFKRNDFAPKRSKFIPFRIDPFLGRDLVCVGHNTCLPYKLPRASSFLHYI